MRSYEKDMKERLSMTEFCRDVLRLLTDHRIEFLVGGYHALRHHTGIDRETKDFDLMARPSAVAKVLQLCRNAGYGTEMVSSHWLAKIEYQDCFIDLIFNSGNGRCAVDDDWFARADSCRVLDHLVKIVPLEELIWQKAYIMERERFDGADIAHLLLKCGERIDWEHLLGRFAADWRVLFSHLVLFGFIYPSRRNQVPKKVVGELLRRLDLENENAAPNVNVCNGTFLSRSQFTADIEEDGFIDGRLSERSIMSANEIKAWTIAGTVEQLSRDSSSPEE
jgi:hypothetical protein